MLKQQDIEDSDSEDFSFSVLQDIEFIRDKYTDMFEYLIITQSDCEKVSFSLKTLTGQSITASLCSFAYRIDSGEGKDEVFESFEQLLIRVMGPSAYAVLLSRLVARKINISFCFVTKKAKLIHLISLHK